METIEFKPELAFPSMLNSTFFSLWDEICYKKKKDSLGKKNRKGGQEIIIKSVS